MNTTVTPAQLRELLDSPLTDPTLILSEGQPRIVPGSDAADGATLVIVSREDLQGRLPHDRPHSEADLEYQAAALAATVDELGG